MATIALPPPRPALVVMQEGLAQGREGRFLEEATKKILRHWNEPAELFLGEGKETDEFAYRSVPLEKAFTVRVKYRYRGEMKPRRFTFDD